MKFSNIKSNLAFLALISVSTMQSTAHGANPDTEQQRIECGKKIGQTLALCLFKKDDKRTFLEYIQTWRSIIAEYSTHFEKTTIELANKTLDTIVEYITKQKAQNKSISSTVIADHLTNLSKSLPETVAKKVEEAFEQLQMKLLNRTTVLYQFQLNSYLADKLKQK